MSKRTTPSKRRQRQHGVLPAGFDWRPDGQGGGRPRWLPSPTRRRQGWRPFDLAATSARGVKAWMSQGEAIERCKAINAAVSAWTLKGSPVPADMAAFAPPGSVDGTGLTPSQRADKRSIGALVDEWKVSSKFILPRGQGGLAKTTKADYISKIGVFLTALVESEDPAKVEELRRLPIETLAVPDEEDADFPVDDAYQWLLAKGRHDMAYGVLTVASIFFTWCWKKKRIKAMAANPVELVERTSPDGAIRVGTPEEIAALLASADHLRLDSIGDAVLFALDMGWLQADLLPFDRRQVKKLPDPATGVPVWTIPRHARAKTGVISSDIQLTAIGALAMDRIVARHASASVTPTHLIVREPSPRNRTGVWTSRAFNEAWRAVREHAAETCPSLLTGDGLDGSPYNGPFDFQDMRDTFITLAREAELTVEQVCSRSLHANSERVLAVWRKHYGAVTKGAAAAGARKMGAHMDATGWVKALGGQG